MELEPTPEYIRPVHAPRLHTASLTTAGVRETSPGLASEAEAHVVGTMHQTAEVFGGLAVGRAAALGVVLREDLRPLALAPGRRPTC